MRHGRTGYRWPIVGLVLILAGCTSTRAKRPPADSSKNGIVQASGKEIMPGSLLQHDGLVAAEAAYRREEFSKAGEMFAEIADDTKNRPEVAERARFYQAECLRREGYHPKAVDTYHKLLQDFPAGLYREQAVGQMYTIASDWLKPAGIEIANLDKPAKERQEKSWTDSIILANFDRNMPTFDSEGRALKTLDRVFQSDPNGPYADKALFMLGRVHFHRENFKEAAPYFQTLAETYERSPLRDEALMMAIIAKNNSAGGPQYDGKDQAEAMRMINSAKASSPALNQKQGGKFLDEQAIMVRYQQAEKDFETAEFYRRTGHPGSAWFYYELVLRRYPGIKPFAEQAAARQKELNAELNEVKNPTTMGSTRRFWKHYVLGHELPSVKNTPEVSSTELKDLPAPRLTEGPAKELVPAEVRPR
ncbi:MAG: outer membrane protein assembly factor BamD [Gemmataceae bacterium]|nr:outer membrane protein assembly factor BamD [Gemmataceae bacterium]